MHVIADAYYPLRLPKTVVLWRMLGEYRNILELRFMPIAIDPSTQQNDHPSGKHIYPSTQQNHNPSGRPIHTSAQQNPHPSSRPVQFNVPHSIISGLSLFEDDDTGSLYVLFVTAANLFYRLTFPAPLWFESPTASPDGNIGAGGIVEQACYCHPLLQPSSNPGNSDTSSVTEPTLSHFVDPDTVIVAYSNGQIGTMVCPRSTILARDVRTGWLKDSNLMEMLWIPSALAKWVAPTASEVAAMCSLLFGTNLKLVFVLSQDCKLRVWNIANNTMVCSFTLPASHSTSTTTDAWARPVRQDTFSNNVIGKYIQVFDESPDGLATPFEREKLAFKLAVLIPSPVDPFLIVLQGVGDYSGNFKNLSLIHSKSCAVIPSHPDDSKFDEVFVDFRIIEDTCDSRSSSGNSCIRKSWTCWTLWKLRGDPILRYSPLNLSNYEGFVSPMGDRWTTVSTGLTSQRLPALGFKPTATVTELLDYTFHPGRYSNLVIEQALQSYESLWKQTQMTTAFISLRTLRERTASSVGAGIRLQLQNGMNERRMLEAYQKALVDEWTRFLQCCDNLSRAHATPTALSTRPNFGAVTVVHRAGVGILRELDTAQLLSSPNTLITSGTFSLLRDETLRDRYPEFHTKSSRADLITLSKLIDLIKGVTSDAVLDQIYKDLVGSTSLQKVISEHLVDLAKQHLASMVGSSTLRARASSLVTALSNSEVWTRLMNIVSREVTALDSEIPRGLDIVDSSSTRLGSLGVAFVAQSLGEAIAARSKLLFEMMLVIMVIAASPGRKTRQIPAIVMDEGLRLFQTYALLHTLASKVVSSPEADVQMGRRDFNRQKLHDASFLIGQCADLRVYEDSHMTFDGSDTEPFFSQVVRRWLRIPLDFDEGDLATNLRASVVLLLQNLSQPKFILKLGCVMSGNAEVVNAIVKYLPVTSGLEYLAGLGALKMGDYDKARVRFEKAAVTSGEDDLKNLLPLDVRNEGLVGYYKHVAALFKVSPEHAIGFVQAALDNTPDREMSSVVPLLKELFLLNLSVLRYEEAFRAMQANPDQEARLDCLAHLVNVFCEKRQIEALCSGRLAFGDLEEQVESLLWFKAKSQRVWPIGGDPPYYKILYSYYTYRGNHRGAASAMFQYSRRLSELSRRTESLAADTHRVIEERSRALLASMQSLQLVSPESGWLSIPKSSDSTIVGPRPAKRRRLTTFSSTSNIDNDTGNMSHAARLATESVSVNDLIQEYELVMARLVLSDKFPNLVTSNETMSPEDAIALCCQAGLYDTALTVAKVFELEMSGIFASLAVRVVRLASSGNFGLDSGILEGVLEMYDGQMNPSQKLLKMVKQYLDRHDTVATGFHYRRLFIDKVLTENSHFNLPYWLTKFYEIHNAEDLIRIYLKHGLLAEAAKLAAHTVEREFQKGGVQDARVQGRWLPYALLDQLEEYGQTLTGQDMESVNTMRSALESYMTKVTKETINAKVDRSDLMSVEDIVSNVRREAGR
ncbi:hypothetical protein SeLEV6574_g04977 [Synchytrium endobioticum]|uniref:Uncharacterized protein n=1 Tax=Synchytrium endobioticum TaxID=286115 RepID=A0A507CWS1_9FUNG|nr:hypothetical protein SeLEV6574_g04977 [Synchytrium endobioticum]